MHVRLESWLPFSIQVCVNGREYLARRLERAGIGFEKRDNCFTRIDDVETGPRDARRLGDAEMGAVPELLGAARQPSARPHAADWICRATTGRSGNPKSPPT